MKRFSVFFCFFFLLAAAPADEETRATQEELRRRNIYFGDIDGRQSQELSEAVKRYQRKKGLADSGEADRNTLRSLGLVSRNPDEPPPKELNWPEEPVLKSDERLDLQEAVAELVEETGVAPESIQVGPAKKNSTVPPRKNALRSRTAPSTSAQPQGQTRGRTRAISAPRLSTTNPGELPSQIHEFVRSYVKTIGRNRLEDELEFYADSVNYFGSGPVDRRIVEQTLRKYYQRWPNRSYRLLKPVAWEWQQKGGEIVVSYRVSFSLRGSRGKAKGLTENRIVINAATADPRIVSVSEKRVRQ